MTLLPITLVLILAGVVLPQIEGTFSAGPQGLTGTLLAVRELDTYIVTGPAVTPAPAREAIEAMQQTSRLTGRLTCR